jgi:hypothetical protein
MKFLLNLVFSSALCFAIALPQEQTSTDQVATAQTDQSSADFPVQPTDRLETGESQSDRIIATAPNQDIGQANVPSSPRTKAPVSIPGYRDFGQVNEEGGDEKKKASGVMVVLAKDIPGSSDEEYSGEKKGSAVLVVLAGDFAKKGAGNYSGEPQVLDISGGRQQSGSRIPTQRVPISTGEEGLQGMRGQERMQGMQGMRGQEGMQGMQGMRGMEGISGSEGIRGVPVQTIPSTYGQQGIRSERGQWNEGMGGQGRQGVSTYGQQGIVIPQRGQGNEGLGGYELGERLAQPGVINYGQQRIQTPQSAEWNQGFAGQPVRGAFTYGEQGVRVMGNQ